MVGYRTLKLSLLGLLAACIYILLAPGLAHAEEPVAYWDGPDAIVVKHPFFSTGQENGDQDIHAIDNSARFTLDRNSRDPFRFVSDGISVTVSTGDAHCSYTSLYFDLALEGDGSFTAATEYDAAFYSGTKSGVAVKASSIHGKTLLASIGGVDKPCERTFVGQNGIPSIPGASDGNLNQAIHNRAEGLNRPFQIKGSMGAVADISAFRDQLDLSQESETTRYTHRICGTQDFKVSPTPSFIGPGAPLIRDYDKCVDQAKKAYTVIWNYCERYAVTLHDQRARVDSFKSCIQDRSGVDVHSSSLSNTLFNTIDYTGGESCSIRYIGWIICPLSRFMASVTDAAFEGLSEFLVIRPLNRGELAGDALYRAWSLVNNVANVIFIIGFMIIIFSQVTGRGVTNYNVKRLLPKIILTAILVNLSYYICIIAVDLSNIVGTSLKDIIKSIEPEQFTKPSTWTAEVENLLVFGAMAAGGAYVILTASIVAMLPLLLGALLSFLIAVIMMVARYAIIIILIIIAPIAIACTLLPNTQKWYNQWFKLFSSMLMLFPLIAIVFGGSQVAGIIVLNSSLARSTGDITLQLFGLAIMALPLAITPILVRLSGGILNRFGGLVSNNKFFNKTKQRTEDFVQRSKNARDVGALQRTGDKKRRGIGGLRDRLVQRQYLRKARESMNSQELSRSQSKYMSDYAAGTAPGSDKTSLIERGKGKLPMFESMTQGEKFAKNLAKGGVSKSSAEAMAISDEIKINTEQVKAARASESIEKAFAADRARGGNMSELTEIANNSNEDAAIRQAAIEIVMQQGTSSDILSVLKSSGGSQNKHILRTLAKGATSSHAVSQAAFLGQPDVARKIMSGQAAGDAGMMQNIVKPYYEEGEYNEISIGTMDTGALKITIEALQGGYVSADKKDSIVKAAEDSLYNPTIQNKANRKEDREKTLRDLSQLR